MKRINTDNFDRPRSTLEISLIEEYNTNILNLDNLSEAASLIRRNKNILNELSLLDTFDEDILFEMASFSPKQSGLPFEIWLDEEGCERKNTHNQPRIKVTDPNDKHNKVPILISKNPCILAGGFIKKTDIDDVFNFIIKAYDDLMLVWNRKITIDDFKDKYRKDR